MLKYVLLTAVLIAGIGVLGAYIAYRKVFAVTDPAAFDPFVLPDGEQYLPHHGEMRKFIAKAIDMPYKEVRIKSFDGAELYGRYYEVDPKAPLHILFHGYQSSPYRDFSGGLAFLTRFGYNCLLVDQRAHGKSGGRCLSFGVLERFDALCWAKYAEENFKGIPVFLTGISMGAATVLMAAELDLPKCVKGVVADCPYSSPKDIIKSVMEKAKYPMALYPFVRLGARLFGGFDLEAAAAKTAVANAKVPAIIIHGEEDRFVPCEMSREIYENSDKTKTELHIFPKAGHGLCHTLDVERYERIVLDFIKRYAK